MLVPRWFATAKRADSRGFYRISFSTMLSFRGHRASRLDTRSSVTKVGVFFLWSWSNVPVPVADLTLRLAIFPSRRLADEDDELSEVQPDAVPPEVREWLASTFTRQLATTRRKADEKPKFRSVAHAIRAGIFVDRIYRRVTNTALMQFPSEVVKVLKVNRLEGVHVVGSRSWKEMGCE